nr:substrate-binding domain-containing protein [Salsipaludibacter albus]
MRRRPETLAADPFFAPLLAGIEQVLAGHGRSLVLRVVDDEAERDAYHEMVKAGIAGFVLTDLRVDDPRGSWLRDLASPAVALGRPDQAAGLPAVELDDRAAIADSVDHLVALGHARIAHVTGIPGMVHTDSRIEAFRSAMTRCGLDPGLVEVGDFTADGGAGATKRLFSTGRPEPTAIVYANDLMAMAGLAALDRMGRSVPGDVSITGFDDVPLAAYASPPLTTVTSDALGWGRAAARLLLEIVDGDDVTDLTLPPSRLVLRGSTGPPPDGP